MQRRYMKPWAVLGCVFLLSKASLAGESKIEKLNLYFSQVLGAVEDEALKELRLQVIEEKTDLSVPQLEIEGKVALKRSVWASKQETSLTVNLGAFTEVYDKAQGLSQSTFTASIELGTPVVRLARLGALRFHIDFCTPQEFEEMEEDELEFAKKLCSSAEKVMLVLDVESLLGELGQLANEVEPIVREAMGHEEAFDWQVNQQGHGDATELQVSTQLLQPFDGQSGLDAITKISLGFEVQAQKAKVTLSLTAVHPEMLATMAKAEIEKDIDLILASSEEKKEKMKTNAQLAFADLRKVVLEGNLEGDVESLYRLFIFE